MTVWTTLIAAAVATADRAHLWAWHSSSPLHRSIVPLQRIHIPEEESVEYVIHGDGIDVLVGSVVPELELLQPYPSPLKCPTTTWLTKSVSIKHKLKELNNTHKVNKTFAQENFQLILARSLKWLFKHNLLDTLDKYANSKDTIPHLVKRNWTQNQAT